MSKGKQQVVESALRKALKVAASTDMPVRGFEVARDGRIIVTFGAPDAAVVGIAGAAPANEWDTVK